MRSVLLFIPLLLIALVPLFAQRSFNEIFPDIPPAIREAAFSSEGFSQSKEKSSPSAKLSPSDLVISGRNSIDPQTINFIFSKQPGFIVESILVIPDKAGKYSLLTVYNALGKVRALKGRLYHSFTRNEYVPLFEDATRIESAPKNTPIADPAPASSIPPSETIYMRFKDVNFGNTYYRGDIALSQYGLRYSLSNNKNMTYFLVPVIKEGKFNAQLYFEPISEGILIYGLAGADVSDFVSSKIDMTSAISKRLAVIIGWVEEGITGN